MKAKGLANPNSVQMRRLRDAIELINTGNADVDGTRQAIVRAREPYSTHLQALPAILAEARSEGRCICVVSNQHVVVGHDFTHPSAVTFQAPDVEEARSVAGWRSDHLILHFGTSPRRMRDRRGNFRTSLLLVSYR